MEQGTKTMLRMIGSHKGTTRKAFDFYPTPPEGTQGLLKYETFAGNIWECAAGDGAMAQEINRVGYNVIATDIFPRADYVLQQDFLIARTLAAPNIVTNPPFKYAQEFVSHALYLGASKVCMLLRLQFLEGQERGKWFETTPPSRVRVFSKRLAFFGRKGGMIALAWYIWDKSHEGPTTLHWIQP